MSTENSNTKQPCTIDSVVVSISNDELNRQIHSSFEWVVNTSNNHYWNETDERLFEMYFNKSFNRMLEIENYPELTDKELEILVNRCIDVF